MNKKFSNIIFISALAILAILLGINVINGFRNIEVKDIYGDRSELGDVDVSVQKNLGSFFYKIYNVGADSVSSKMMFVDESDQGIDFYKNKDVLRGVYTNVSNSYDGEEYLAVVDVLNYDKGIMNLILKNKKTGEVEKAKIKNPYGPRILGVYGENNKVKILMPENDEEASSPIIIAEYNFETKDFNKVASYGIYSEKMGLEYRDGENFYIVKISRTYDENKHVEETKDLNIYKFNLKENTFEDYDIRKILEENKIDLSGKSLESAECDGNLIYVKISDAIEWEKIFKDEKKMAEYKGRKSEVPKIYSVATINMKDLKVNYYKDIIDENKIEEYVKDISQPMYLRVFDNKLYFTLSVGESNLLVVGVINLENGKLAYLGEMNKVTMNGFYKEK